jgi:hypothetical protein
MRSFRRCLVLCEHAETRNQTHGNGEGDSLFSSSSLIHSKESYSLPGIMSWLCDESILSSGLYVQLLQQRHGSSTDVVVRGGNLQLFFLHQTRNNGRCLAQ